MGHRTAGGGEGRELGAERHLGTLAGLQFIRILPDSVQHDHVVRPDSRGAVCLARQELLPAARHCGHRRSVPVAHFLGDCLSSAKKVLAIWHLRCCSSCCGTCVSLGIQTSLIFEDVYHISRISVSPTSLIIVSELFASRLHSKLTASWNPRSVPSWQPEIVRKYCSFNLGSPKVLQNEDRVAKILKIDAELTI